MDASDMFGRSLPVLDNDTGENLRIIESNSWTKNGGRTSLGPNPSLRKRTVSYTPPADFVGDDEFWYVFEDEQGRTNAAKVIVTVKPSGGKFPDPKDDEVTVQVGTKVCIDVLKNDDIGGALIVEFNDWSEKGGRIARSDSASADRFSPNLTYTPPGGFTGTDTFWYVVQNGDFRRRAR